MTTKNTAQNAATQDEAVAQNTNPSTNPDSAKMYAGDDPLPERNKNSSVIMGEKEMQGLAEQISDKVADRMKLSQDTTEASKELLTRLSGTKPEDFTDEESEIFEAVTEHATQKLLNTGAVRVAFTEEQNQLLMKMYEIRRTTARKTNLQTMQELFTKAISKALLDDSKSLYQTGQFSKVYGFSYEDLKKAFSS